MGLDNKTSGFGNYKSYQAVQTRIADLKRQMDAQPSKKLTQDFNRASREAEQLKNRINEQGSLYNVHVLNSVNMVLVPKI